MIGFLLQYQMDLLRKILLLLIAVIAINAAVTVNPISGVSSQNLVYSGLIPISASSNLFFTYYGVDGQTDQNNLKKYPLLIVVGNPGSSAQYYSLGGIGPVNLNNDMTLSANPNRFTTTANLMFLDLFGSGFSFAANTSDLPSDAKTFGEQVSLAINTFAKESVLGQSSKIVIAGEGTFIRSLIGLSDISTLKGIIHLSPWPEMYAIGQYYGVAGVDLGIYGSSQKIAIQSTWTSCYNYIRSSKYLEAHQCLETILNFVESRTKNANLFDVRLKSNLTQFTPMIQYYFSQPSVVSAWKTPTAKLFEGQSGWIYNKTFVDLSKNYTSSLSQFMRDYFSVRHWFVVSSNDYIGYNKGVRSWLENELSFVENDAFKKAKLDDVVIDGTIVGYAKAVKQVAFSQIINSGHHLFHDAPKTMSVLFKSWLDSLSQPVEEIKNISVE